MYRINIKYRTGDSFKNYETEQELPLSWLNIDVAKENLKRIKEHYLWQASYGGWSKKVLSIPDFVLRNFEKIEHKVPTSYGGEKSLYYDAQYYLFLLKDDGEEVQQTCFWVGYFETLLGAEIVTDQDDGWSFGL